VNAQQAQSWTTPLAEPIRESILSAIVEDEPIAPAFLALARFSYEAGAFFPTAQGAGPVVIHVEAGSLTFHVEKPVYLVRAGTGGSGKPPARIPPGTEFTIGVGDQLHVPGDTPHSAKSNGPETAVTMGLAAFRTAPQLTFPPGIQFHPLVLGPVQSLPSSPALHTIDRTTLPPGAGEATRVADGPSLRSVESGSLTLTVTSGDVSVIHGPGSAAGPPPLEPVTAGSQARLAAGDGAIVQAGAAVSVRNDGSEPVTFLEARAAPAPTPGSAEAADDGRPVAQSFYYDAWDRGNPDLVDQLFAPDFVDHLPLAGQQAGPEGIKQLIRGFHSAFPDFSLNVDLMIAESDRVATRYTFRGTQQGSFLGIPATGKPVELTGIGIVRIDAGKIKELWGYWDTASLVFQLGLITFPSPPGGGAPGGGAPSGGYTPGGPAPGGGQPPGGGAPPNW